MSEDDFVASVTEGQPLVPQYFEFDAERNRQLRPLLDDDPPSPLTLDEVLDRHAGGAVLLDCREPADFAAGHLRGALNIGLQGRFAEWAGDVLSPSDDVVLVGDPSTATEAKVRLARVGYDRVVGQLDDPAAASASLPDRFEASSRLTVDTARGHPSRVVGRSAHRRPRPGRNRSPDVIAASRQIPSRRSPSHSDTFDRDAPVVVYCASGYRSSIAASILRATGFGDVSDLLGGYGAWVHQR